MSRESVEIVREPLTLRGASRRRLEEHVIVRFPGVAAAVVRAVLRMPGRSRLRRALIRRTVASAWEALNRRDLDSVFALYDPGVVSEYDPGLVSVGFANTRDREARIDVQREGLAGLNLRFESSELIYVGASRLLSLGHMKGSGTSSGAAFDTEWAALLTLAAGRVVHERIFLDRREALEAIGVREGPAGSVAAGAH